MKKAFFILFFVGCAVLITKAQSYSFEIQLKNQSDNHIVLGNVSGDDFEPLDTILLHHENNNTNESIKKGVYTFSKNSIPVVYRLILGKTTYAKVMDEEPQQLDFIFNNEDIILETDFKNPEDDLLVVLSEENRVWFEFLQRENSFQKKLDELEKEVDYFGEKSETNTDSGNRTNEEKWKEAVKNYNSLQLLRDKFITEITVRNPDLFATKLVKMHREPFLDGNLQKSERRKRFQNEFFQLLDFSDESLMNSSVYTDKIFKYLTSYNQRGFAKEQLEKEYIKAVDLVLASTNHNQKVYEFILDYIVHGFEVLKMENVLNYIAENYSGTTCQTDEVTTLERKLEAQKMKPGTVVPDFTMPDTEGFYITLSDIQKEKTLILFWASWCPHCNQMIPDIKKWVNKQNEMQVVTVSLDESKTDWKNAIENLGINNWINLSDLKKWDGEVTTEYNVYATPTMFLIDINRNIIATPLTINDLEKLAN